MATSFKNMIYDLTPTTSEQTVYGIPTDSHSIINAFYVNNTGAANGGSDINIEVRLDRGPGRNYVANQTIVFSTPLISGQYLNLLTGPLVLEGGDKLVFTTNTTGRVQGTIAAMQVNREDQETTPIGSV
jgi:hypothetical protein